MATVRETYHQYQLEYQQLLNSDLSSADPKYQETLRALLQNVNSLWNEAKARGVISLNDELQDLPTFSLELLGIPFLLGDLQLRLISNDIKRVEILKSGINLLDDFLQMLVQLALISEKEIEMGCQSSSRDFKVKLFGKQQELSKELLQFENKKKLIEAREKQMKRLMEEDGEEGPTVDLSSEHEEILRQAATKKLEWYGGEAMNLIQFANRETEMLEKLSEEERRKISDEYQKKIEDSKNGENTTGRQTYAILPGGLIVTHASLRESVKEQAFVQSNQPTMTLEEFAQMEMAKMQQDMQSAAEAQATAKEEDEKLGEDGIEERERKKQADWDDWRDANPPIGLTTKGNYS